MKPLFSILLLLSSFSAVFPCTCANTANISGNQHSKYLKEVKAIFYGEVVSLGEKRIVGKLNEYQSTFQTVKFKVFRAWKNVDNSEITVETEIESSCQFIPKIGNKLGLCLRK